MQNVVGYMIYGDYREPNPPARLIEAVEKGDIDIAGVWGPLAGYAAETSPVPLTVAPIADTEDFGPLRFQFDIAMGVRKRDHALKARLDDIIVYAGRSCVAPTKPSAALRTLGSILAAATAAGHPPAPDNMATYCAPSAPL